MGKDSSALILSFLDLSDFPKYVAFRSEFLSNLVVFNMNGCFSFSFISCTQTKFLKHRTNILLKDKLSPDFCHGFFWSEENVDLNYFLTLDGAYVLVCP